MIQRKIQALMCKATALIFTLFFTQGVFAQEATLKGVVLDVKDGSPLIGVNIVPKGATTGVVTDLDGNFSLSLNPGLHRVEFTYVGYDKYGEEFFLKQGEVKEVKIKMTSAQKELDILVVTGSKYEKKLGEEVVSMEVMKQQSITQSNYKMEEALNRIPGINMVGNNASIRGGSGFSAGAGSKVLALLDEMPLISPENGSIPWETLPVEAVEQIEVIKGASSALYGSSAMNGIINIRTMNPRTEPYNKLLVNYGFYQQPKNKDWSWTWRRADTTSSGKVKHPVKNRPMFGGFQFTHMKKYGDFDVVLSANFQHDDSHLESAEKTRMRSFFKLRYMPKKLKRLTVGVNGNLMYTLGKDFFIMSGIDSGAYFPTEIAIISQRYINIDPYINYYDKKENRHSLKFRYYNTELNNGAKTFSALTPGDSSKSNLFYIDYSYYKHFKKVDLHLTAGANGFYSKIRGNAFGEKYTLNSAAYVQLEKRFWKRLTLSTGVRLEYVKLDTSKTRNELWLIDEMLRRSGDKAIFIPVKPVFRIGLNFQATEGTFLRVSFGQGYRYPAIAEKFVTTRRSGMPVVPNPDLLPEHGLSAELGIKQGVKFSNWLCFIDVSAYITRYKDMIEFVPTEPNFYFQARNVENTRIWGTEFSAMGQGKIFGVPLNFLLGYTYMNPKKLNYNPDPNAMIPDSKFLKYRVEHTAKADIQSSYRNFNFGVTAVYNSYMRFVDPIVSGSYDYLDKFRLSHKKGFFWMDVRAGYTFREKLSFNVVAKNVTNTAYWLRPGILEAPTNYSFQVGYQF